MIPFDAQDPFPLLPHGSYGYAQAKEHAVLVDQWLGFQIQEAEEKLFPLRNQKPDRTQEFWIGLDAQSFLTPYIEIRTILDLLGPQGGETIIDLGCGYGRMGHVLGRHYPQVSFLGYEIVSERLEEARKSLRPFQYPNVQIQQKDLAHEAPQSAPYYFIYDYGSKPAIEKTLLDLREISKHQPIQVVARGRASRFYIHQSHPWLGEVQEPRHFETFSIYKS